MTRAPREPAPNRDETIPSGRILLVDDNPEIILLTERFLTRHGHRTVSCATGEAALEICQEQEIDVVLLDILLPDLDGLEVCRRLKSSEATRKIMVLLLTGCGGVRHRVEGLEAGADDYITKPFHVTELLARVDSALRIKRLTDEIEHSHCQLLESQKERLRAEKMATIGLLATGIAHEFNNILSGISGFAQLANRDPRYREQLVSVALTQSRRAMEIANSLSTFYRPGHGKEEFDLGQLVESALLLLTPQIQDREIELDLQFEEEVRLHGHPGQIQEVLLNLCLNALQAMGQGGQLGVHLEATGDSAIIRVSDTGGGIAPDVIERIFDPFFTTKGALGGGESSGSGLGLSVCHNIVTSHAGRLEFDNRPGEGVTFEIVLPLQSDPERSTPSRRRPAPADLPRILVADANRSIQEITEKFLTARDAECCTSWEELEEKLGSRRVDTILVDVDMDCPEPLDTALERLAGEHPGLKIILTSESHSDPRVGRCQGQIRGHLLKPYSIENLADLIES